MAVYYKFKSAKDYHSIPIDGPFISIINLKERIFNSKLHGKGKDYDLVITNAQTNEDYLDEAMLIPKNISVLIRRIPGPPCKPIVTQPDKPKVENEYDQHVKDNCKANDCSGSLDIDDSEWNDVFGSSLYTTSASDAVPSRKSDEDNKIKAVVENSGLKQLNHHTEGFLPGRRAGRVSRGFGQGGWESKTPPQGYICRRCKVAGHFIQHCPTNGDRDYDIKKTLIGIPKPNEALFEKEMEGLPSTHCRGDLPPELHCPLCNEVMKDAVLTSKCCFGSFCDKCIRDNIISKSMCICGAREILADDLIPNMTLRDTISRILESGSSSANSGSSGRLRAQASTHSPQPRILPPTQSAASKGDQMVPSGAKETPNIKENVEVSRHNDASQQPVQSSGEVKIAKVPVLPNVSEAAPESFVKKVESAVEEGQQKVAAVESGKKNKIKKMPNPATAADMGWSGMQPFMDGYMDPSAYNTYWSGMQPAVNEFWSPFGGNIPYNMGYGFGPFGNFIHPYPSGAQGFMNAAMLSPWQRDIPQNRDSGREPSSIPSIQSKHNQAPARRYPSEGRYIHHHDHDHGHKNEQKRSSLGHLRSQSKPSFSTLQPSEASSDKNHRKRGLVRVESEVRRTKPRQECVV